MTALPELITCILEFLEVAVHTTLSTRGLYHKEVFERCRAFGVFTRRSRHPELNSYIQSTVSRLRVSAGLHHTASAVHTYERLFGQLTSAGIIAAAVPHSGRGEATVSLLCTTSAVHTYPTTVPSLALSGLY